MKKGTSNAEPTMAASKQGARNTAASSRNVETAPAVPAGTTRIRVNTKRAGGTKSKSRDNHNHPGAESKPRTAETVRATPEVPAAPAEAGKRARRLVKRSKQATAIDSYDFGYKSGYAAGEEDQKELLRLQTQESDGVTPRNLKIFQASTVFLLGMMVGMFF